MPLTDFLLALAVPVLWGVGFTPAKPAVAHFSPLLLMTIAYLVTLLALRPGAGPIRTPWWSLFVIAALGATIQGGLIFSGLRELPAATATLVIQLQVPSAVLWAWLLGRDRPDRRRMAGIAVALAGVALVVGSPSAAGARPPALVILGSLSWPPRH